MTDPIADMINRIKNSQAVGQKTVEIPYSNLKYGMALIMEKAGFLAKAEKKGRKVKKVLELELKYQEGAPAVSGVRRASKPGQRIYLSSNKIRPVKGGYGLSIVSTSQGLMTGREARKRKLGGEILCEIW